MNDETQHVSKNDETKHVSNNEEGSHLFSVSLRGLIAAGVIGTVCAMAVLGRTVEEPMYSIAVAVMGFYYGQKTSGKN